MPVPDFQSLMLPVLRLAGDGGEHNLAEANERMASEFRLSEDERNERLQSGGLRLYNRIVWAITYLTKAHLLKRVGPGRFILAERGREVLTDPPQVIDIAFLRARSPEMSEFRRRPAGSRPSDTESEATFDAATGVWIRRPDIEQRIQDKIERSLPDEPARRAALDFLGFAIENADEERSSAWYLRETAHGVRLMTGRLLACEVTRSRMRVSVIGPIDDDVRVRIGAEPERDEEFKSIQGSLLLTLPPEHAAAALESLKDAVNLFIDLAMAKVRSSVDLNDHVPEAIDYIGGVVGRDLPQPIPGPESPESDQDDTTDSDDSETSREPAVRGRAPIFEHGQRSIASLISDVEREVIALPDLQRPFVWEDTKVRDLLDSIFVGFPVGTLVFWHTSSDKDARALGAERPSLRATTLVIDGQQRLTSLFAVMKGVRIIGKDREERRINIAFRPRDGRFEVADAAIRRDPEFLADATELWSGTRTKPQIRRDLLNALRDKGRAVDEKYEDAVERNIDRAHAINDYRFPTVDIRKTAASQEEEATEEDVAEIFVRINNQGTRLGQADFVLTLLSVFHGPLRDRIEKRAREMSTGTVVSIDTQQLLRAVCAVAFGRARMGAVYRFLRGVDPTTGQADIAGRVKRLEQLDAAADLCMEPTPWRDYLLRVQHGGFVSQSLIASKNAIVNGYAFYIRGRNAEVSKRALDEVISRWVFVTLLTARYSGSSETMFEQDLARVTGLHGDDAEGFVAALDGAMGEAIGGDYWNRTLVSALETQKGRSPTALAFRAAQVVLGTRALFSDQLLQTLLTPAAQGGRSANEIHHLFPEAWLHSQGIDDRRLVNQVANLADVGWYDNSVIGARGPSQYVPRLREKLRIDDNRWGRMCAEHALPLGWEVMKYDEFLHERRQRMAELTRAGFRQLGGEADETPIAPPWFVAGAEVVWQRIVQVERALRDVVRDVYVALYGDAAAEKIEKALPEQDRQNLAHSLRARPDGASALSIVDYLYLATLPNLLFLPEVWQEARTRFGGDKDSKGRLQVAIQQIAPVRNEIAHVREVAPDRLMRVSVACNDVLAMIRHSS